MLLIAVASVSTYKVVVAKKNKRISDDMVKLREAEIANQQKTIDNQQLEMKIDKLNLLKSSAKTLIESKLRIIQKMNDILKLWSDDRRDNRALRWRPRSFSTTINSRRTVGRIYTKYRIISSAKIFCTVCARRS